MKYTLKKHEINGYKLFESLYPSKLKQPRHTHTAASFSFVLAGNYIESYGRQTSKRSPFTLILHPPQESHAVEYENDVRILSVQFDLKKFAQMLDRSIILGGSSSYHSETVACLGNRIHREFRRMDSFSWLAIEGLVLELVAEASRGRIVMDEKGIPQWLAEAKDFLHDNFTESFVLEDIARTVGVHAVHLSRVFRKKFGCTIGEYVRGLRVEFAARQLLQADASIGEIAHEAGFADQSHLNKTFKNRYGILPAEYRRISPRS